MKKNKGCKLICMMLVLAMLLGLLVGCVSGGGEATKPSTTESTGGDVPGTTKPTASDPEVTEPSGTEPADPGMTEVTDPVVTEPTDVTEPIDVTEPVVPTEPTPPVVTEPGHEHEYSKTTTKATCVEDGYATYSCECGDSYVGELTPATGHKYGDWATTKEPTEEATGIAERTCSICDGKETKVLDKLIPNHTHSYTGKVTKKATCSAEGVKTYTCSCGGSYTESIAKTSHSYKSTVTKPTCEEKGYTTYKCSACGDTYKDNYKDTIDHCYFWEYITPTCTEYGYTLYMCDECADWYEADIVPATGHNYQETVIAPTCTEKGYTVHKCSRCGDSYKDCYTDPIEHSYKVIDTCEATLWIQSSVTYRCQYCSDKYTEYGDPLIGEEKDKFLREVADATVKYINQFRKEQGDNEAISLPGLTLVAEYRAVQLQTNFEHSTADLREAYAYYKYGEWVDATKYGDDAKYSHYTANAKEAITKGAGLHGTADEIGYDLARSFLDSPGHWSYVGSSDFPYIGVGVTYDSSNWYSFKCCVLQTKENYG